MTEITRSLSFQKSIRTGTRFLKQIWRVDQKDIETIKTYKGYFKKGTCSYVNDFEGHCSYLAKDLSLEEILSIHEINADLGSTCGNKESNHHKKIISENKLYRHLSSNTNNTEKDDWTAKISDVLLGKQRKWYEIKSTLLFYCLSYQIGTFYLIKCRQKIYGKYWSNAARLNNEISGIIDDKTEVIGSKSEGLDMEGSDVDMLKLFPRNAYELPPDDVDDDNDWEEEEDESFWKLIKKVYLSTPDDLHSETHQNLYNETLPEITGDYIEQLVNKILGLPLIYNSVEQGVYPGYVLLRMAGLIILPSSDYVHILPLNQPGNMAYESIHGPAISIFGDAVDLVSSIRSPDWPEKANEWITRPRKFGWPSEEMITNITRKGCYIVPVGSTRNHKADSDWRLSFCVAERELIWTFNHPQILIYGLLKLILKEILNQTIGIKNVICSYFLKTVMFWVIEETSRNIWCRNNMIYLFQICFDKLVQFVIEYDCPNYFIPSNNMFGNRFNTTERTKLLQVLRDIDNSGMSWMNQSKSFRPFAELFRSNAHNQRNAIESIGLKAIQKGKIQVHLLIQEVVLLYRDMICLGQHKIKNTIKYIFRTIPSPAIRPNVLPFAAHFLQTNCNSVSNKLSATFRKLHMQLLLQEAFRNTPNGKHTLTLNFYDEGKFNDCLSVWNSMVNNMEFCIYHYKDKMPKYENLFEIYLNCKPNAKNLKYFFTYDIKVPYMSRLISKELVNDLTPQKVRVYNQECNESCELSFYPECFVHFLRCLCFVKLCDFNKAYDALFSLANVEYVANKIIYEFRNIHLQVYSHSLKNGEKSVTLMRKLFFAIFSLIFQNLNS